MIRATILFEDGFAETHFAFSPDCDNAICGQDLSGDDRAEEHGTYGISEIFSYKSVNCEHCLEITWACKKTRLRKLEKRN